MKTHKKPPKREPSEFWYDSMKHFATATGRPISDIKRAKEDSRAVEMFKGNRVSEKLALWLDRNPPEKGELSGLDKERLECDRIEKQNRKMDFDHQIKLAQYVKIDSVKEKWATAMEAIMDAMKGLMTREDFNASIKQIRANIKGLDL